MGAALAVPCAIGMATTGVATTGMTATADGMASAGATDMATNADLHSSYNQEGRTQVVKITEVCSQTSFLNSYCRCNGERLDRVLPAAGSMTGPTPSRLLLLVSAQVGAAYYFELGAAPTRRHATLTRHHCRVSVAPRLQTSFPDDNDADSEDGADMPDEEVNACAEFEARVAIRAIIIFIADLHCFFRRRSPWTTNPTRPRSRPSVRR